MQGKTHLIAGLAIGLAMSSGQSIAPALGMAAAAGIGALIPDIDHPKSIIGRRAGIAGAAIRLAVSHRGVLHSALAAAIVFGAALAVPTAWRDYAMAGAAGYASHIALDMLTGAGVPLFWPSRRRVSLLPIRTGGVIERLLFVAILVGAGYLIWALLH